MEIYQDSEMEQKPRSGLFCFTVLQILAILTFGIGMLVALLELSKHNPDTTFALTSLIVGIFGGSIMWGFATLVKAATKYLNDRN